MQRWSFGTFQGDLFPIIDPPLSLALMRFGEYCVRERKRAFLNGPHLEDYFYNCVINDSSLICTDFSVLKVKKRKKMAFYRAAMYNVIGNRLNFCNRIVKLWREIDSSRKKLKISTGHGTLSNFGKKIYNHIRFNLFYAISIFIYLFIIFNKPKIIDIDFVSNFLK